MPVNANIPLMLQQPNTGGAINNAMQQRNQNQSQENQNQIAAQQALKLHYDNLDAREKSRLQSVIAGAVQLKPFLDAGDIDGALQFANQRRNSLQGRIGQGENIDTEDTDYAIAALQSRDPEKIKMLQQEMQGLLAAGQVYGILGKENEDPSSIREWKQFQAMTPEEQKQYLIMKRANPYLNLGDTMTQPDPITGLPDKVLPINPKVSETPEFEREVERAKEEGKLSVANQETLGNLQNMKDNIQVARALIPTVAATGPILGRIGALAEDPQYRNLEGALNSITLLAKDLYNLGSGQGFTDADRKFLQEIVGGKYARAETIGLALDRMEKLIDKRATYLEKQNAELGGKPKSGGGQSPQSAGDLTPEQIMQINDPAEIRRLLGQ